MPIRKKLGEILVEQTALSPGVVEQALARQPKEGKKIGRLLVEAGAIGEEQLARALSAQSRMPMAKMKSEVAPALAAAVPAELAIRHQAVPFGSRTVDGVDTVYIAVTDPYDVAAMDEIRACVGKPIKFALAPADEIARALARIATRTEEMPAGAPVPEPLALVSTVPVPQLSAAPK
ncbi:MAG: hypothetical protein HY901_29630, partial [Deltaproteobacteria bacterium]|nr:hypothetical protein [Deltaproteobacteria bacterium]